MFLFLFGTIVGSFLCLVSVRLPLQMSLIQPRSHCLHCGQQLSFFDLIPLFSALVLKFKCRYCQASIPFQSFFFELFCGWAFLYFLRDFSWLNLWYLLFLLVELVLAAIDFDYLVVDMYLFFSSSLLLFLVGFWVVPQIFWWHPFLIAAGFFGLQLFMPRSMGLGDLWVVGFWSLFLSGHELLQLIFIASASGIAFGLLLKNQRRRLPFLPFLLCGLVFIFVKRVYFQF